MSSPATTAVTPNSRSSHTLNAWGLPPPSKTTNNTFYARSPTIQEILDEELARQLHQAEIESTEDADPASLLVDADVIPDAKDEDDDGEFDDEEDDELDYEDDYADADDVYLSKTHRMRGGSRRGRDADSSPKNIRLTGTFDDRTRWVLGKLAGRGILNAVTSRLHSSLSAQIHIGSNDVVVDSADEVVHKTFAVKVLKLTPTDRPVKHTETTGNTKFHGRPMDEDMLWMSMRRQLKIRMDREHAAQVRAIACGVRAPTPVCSWEHVMVMEFVGTDTKAAPCLRDVVLRPGQLAQAFVDLLVSTRAMFQQAKIVHGGLSEFSVLYHNDACWITDFSTAIDTVHTDHAEALDRDVAFLHGFFDQRGMPKASKHEVGLLNPSAIRELITEEAPARILGAFPWIKPYLYKKK